MGLIIVVGPPAAGKTTWTRTAARPGDVVIDFDALACSLTAPGGDEHDHPGHIRAVAYRARAAAIDEALRHIETCDVYVIHSSPRPEAMARYAQHHGRVVTIDPGREVVMERCRAQRPASALAYAVRWYAQHSDAPLMVAKTSRDW